MVTSLPESLHKSRLRFYKSRSSYHKSGIRFYKSGTCFYKSPSCETKSGSCPCKSRICDGKPVFCEDKAENLWRQVSEMCGSLFCCSIIWLARIYLYVHYVRKKHSPVHRLFILHWFPSVLRVKACAVKHSRLRFLLWTLHSPTLHAWNNWKINEKRAFCEGVNTFSGKKIPYIRKQDGGGVGKNFAFLLPRGSGRRNARCAKKVHLLVRDVSNCRQRNKKVLKQTEF